MIWWVLRLVLSSDDWTIVRDPSPSVCAILTKKWYLHIFWDFIFWSVHTNNSKLVFTFNGHFYLHNAIFLKVLSQIHRFNHWIRIPSSTGAPQGCVLSPLLLPCKSTQKLRLTWRLDEFTHCLMQDVNAFNL